MRLASAIAFVLATALGAMPGHAQTWAALLIGNGGYQNAPVLPNPSDDASDIAASLERLGLWVRRDGILRAHAPRPARFCPAGPRTRNGRGVFRRARY